MKELIRQIACAVCKALGNGQSLGKPISTQTIDSTELYKILRLRFPTDGQLYLSDKEYKLCHIEDIECFLIKDETNRVGYIPEERDCDDFAYRLMGQFSIPGWSDLTLGIVWTDLHALNCFIDEDKKFWFIEPQKDELQPFLEEWQGKTIRFIMM